MNLKPIIISAPFGNWCRYPGATSTLGTYTLAHRDGLLKHLWRCLLTLRYDRHAGGWVNRLGLPNPGIKALHLAWQPGDIVSVHGFTALEWAQLVGLMPLNGIVELNLSCPNAGHKVPLCDVSHTIRDHANMVEIIAKLPPVKRMHLARPLYDLGVRCFHACNTLPVLAGGLSGKALKQLSLWAVEELKDTWGDTVKVIGGGGVTHAVDYYDYRLAGADHVAIGSALLNPLNWRRIRRLIEDAGVDMKGTP